MCGFFFTDSKEKLVDLEFNDVKQRGFKTSTIEHNEYFGVQSVLPSSTGLYSQLEDDNYFLLFTGQVYNYSRKFKTDTDYVFTKLKESIDNVNLFNGMFAFVFVNKTSNQVYIARDKTGQIPLFIYYKDKIIVSNTLKSIVKNTDTNIRENLLETWSKTKHYISNNTPWNDIQEFPSGYLYTDGNFTKINGPAYNNYDVLNTLELLKIQYSTPLPSANIASGGVDSTIISHVFAKEKICINNLGKDYISNDCPWAIDVTEKEWCQSVVDFINNTYILPYTWSWVSYFIIGKHLHNKVNVLYTGEGADEIFGGYPGYTEGVPTPYSDYGKNNSPIENKLKDQEVFIPISTMGANLALGCFTIEPRSPFCDLMFLNNTNYVNSIGKPELVKLYKKFTGKEPKPKQGFSGFPNEFYNYYNNKNITDFDSDFYWKNACIQAIKDLT